MLCKIFTLNNKDDITISSEALKIHGRTHIQNKLYRLCTVDKCAEFFRNGNIFLIK